MLCAGLLLAAIGLLCPDFNPANAGAVPRTLSFYNIHTKERLTVTYKVNDRYVPSAMAKLNHFMRDWRKDQQIVMDPELIDLIWTVYTKLGATEPIELISGYRSPATNEALRKAGGGQARYSQHTLGKAADIHIPGIPVKTLRNCALIQEWGGVGYYPSSGVAFVHVDVGRVRMWPRIPRLELAALFPSGKSGYIPSDGRPISQKDYRVAAASGKYQLASAVIPHRVATTEIAAAETAAPQQVALAGAPAMTMPTPKPRQFVTASLGGSPGLGLFGAKPKPELQPVSYEPMSLGKADAPLPAPRPHAGGTGLASAPAAAIRPSYRDADVMSIADDDEHPDEELTFVHYSIASLMGERSVADDPAIAPLSPPEQNELSYMFEDLAMPRSLQLRDNRVVMSLAANHDFEGPAVRSLYAELGRSGPTRLASSN